METRAVVQIVISQLEPSASRKEFLDLHERTAPWMKSHSDCLRYEVYEGKRGAIADRIPWKSQAGAIRGNEEYSATQLATGMQGIVESYTSFFGEQVPFE